MILTCDEKRLGKTHGVAGKTHDGAIHGSRRSSRKLNYLDWDVLQNGAGTYTPASKTLTIPVQGNLNYYGTYQWGTGTDVLVLTSGSIPE